MVQSGEHIKRDFGKLGQCPEKNDALWERPGKHVITGNLVEGGNGLHDSGLQIFMEKGLGLSHAA